VGVAPSSASTAPVATSGAPDFSSAPAGQTLLGANMNTLVTIATGSIFAIIDLDSLPAGGSLFIDDPAMVAMLSDGDLAMAINITGLRCGVFASGFVEIPAFGGDLSGAPHVTQMRWGGGAIIEAAIDGGAWQSQLAAGPDSVTALSKYGSNYNSSSVLDGREIALFLCTAKVTDLFATKFHKWAQCRHGVA
jgi:hypothetical protein